MDNLFLKRANSWQGLVKKEQGPIFVKSIGNRATSRTHIQPAIDLGKHIEGVRGIVVIIGDDVGIWGDLKVVPLKLEKG